MGPNNCLVIPIHSKADGKFFFPFGLFTVTVRMHSKVTSTVSMGMFVLLLANGKSTKNIAP